MDVQSPIKMVTPEKMKSTKKTPHVPIEVSNGSDDDSYECESFNVHDYNDVENEVQKEVKNKANNEVKNEVGKEPVNEHVIEAVKEKWNEPVNEYVSEAVQGNGKRKGKFVISDDDVDCDELNSDSESDEEGERKKFFLVFNAALKKKNPTFKLGMIFSDHNVLKDALKIIQSRMVKTLK